MSTKLDTQGSINRIKRFLKLRNRPGNDPLKAISLFSGCGLSDVGYEFAGFKMAVQVEKNKQRAEIGEQNFAHSRWIAKDVEDVVDEVVRNAGKKLDLLVATPPCQGMSSSNPSRGKRRTADARRHAKKNRLVLQVIPYVKRLTPRAVIIENVRQVLTHTVWQNGRDLTVPDYLTMALPDYTLFSGVVNVADYGVPQVRRRGVIVMLKNDEPCLKELTRRALLPWPAPTHAEAPQNGHAHWVTIRQWLRAMKYQSLDAASEGNAIGSEPLHFVPSYDDDRYLVVSDIPKYSGRNAYENDVCPNCGQEDVRLDSVKCPSCRCIMRNRPIVRHGRKVRLIAGFQSSYRRMRPDRPASTVTTNSSHVGSDNKIHPWEHRVLSILECADLQTVPRSFDWNRAIQTKRSYLIRNLIGEAFPPFFTYLHGRAIRHLLAGNERVYRRLAKSE